ncbi:MAG: hypothetical protein IPO09_02220 [Anaeromyxobacter sp.]|nr:hypothetical protein [Anaeromyxobacter sp.]MBL0277537.1 hypothetical protein [Anaeromyxobacter sp.]
MLRRTLVPVSLALLLAGCATIGTYQPAYFDQDGTAEAPAMDEPILVVTGAAEDGLVFKGGPTTSTGSGHILELPLGVIVREAALRAFGEVSRGGARHGSQRPEGPLLQVVVTPRVITFDWAWQAEVFGAGSPQVRLEVSVSRLDGAGQVAWERRYQFIEEQSLGFSAVGDLLSWLTHQAAQKAMRRAARDLSSAPATTAPATTQVPPSPIAAPTTPNPATATAPAIELPAPPRGPLHPERPVR